MMTNASKQSWPFFSWIDAGFELVNDRVREVNSKVESEVSAINENLNVLSERGAEVEKILCGKLKSVADVTQLNQKAYNTIRATVMENSLLSSLFPLKSKKKEQQLAALSAKVDLLVEQVALYAAKEAASKAKKRRTKKPQPIADTGEQSETVDDAANQSLAAKASTPKATPKRQTKTTTSRRTTTRKTSATGTTAKTAKTGASRTTSKTKSATKSGAKATTTTVKSTAAKSAVNDKVADDNAES